MKKENAVISVMGRITKLLISVMIIMFLYVVALEAYDFGYRIFAERPVSMEPGQDVEVVIEEGMGTSAIAAMLEEEGIIRDALIFRIQNQFSHYKGSFRAGEYILNTSMDNDEIMAILSGEVSQE